MMYFLSIHHRGASTKLGCNTHAKHFFQPNTRSINVCKHLHKINVIRDCVRGSFDTHGSALLGSSYYNNIWQGVQVYKSVKLGTSTNITLVLSPQEDSFTSATTEIRRDAFFMKLESHSIHPRTIICLLQPLSIIHHQMLVCYCANSAKK